MNKSSKSPLWRGIHLLLRTNDETERLIGELPALAKLGINTLIAEVNYNFAYDSHPELREANPVSKEHARRLAQAGKDESIRVIPQFQCLGHQSWAEHTFALLRVHPEFDETPGQWLDNKGIYCRSWCPQHPGVNPIVFDLFDELIETFQADALHVGMDEVFLIASEFCPRCKGTDPAARFAQVVNDYHAHLVDKRGVEMLMWGDRLLADADTGYGKWEASANGTDPAADRIPKDIILCDWHYEMLKEYRSVPILLNKGFRVWPGGWRVVENVEALIDYAKPYKNERLLGYLCTTWGTVKPGEFSQWPPLIRAMEKLSAW